jgi:hypothetical protein
LYKSSKNIRRLRNETMASDYSIDNPRGVKR